MAGPAPKSRKSLTASGSSRAKLRAGELELPPGAPIPPDHLGAAARDAWTLIASVLDERGAIAQVDRFALESLCRAVQESHDLTVLAKGMEVGTYKWSATIAARNKAVQQIEKGCKQFGLSPADRPRVQTAKATDGNERKRALLKAPRPLRINAG